MLRVRVIPCLLLKNGSLVKTVKFKRYRYIGDPLNTVRIFNELEVDELMVLDITASHERRLVDFDLLEQMANECFMPLSYGGNINNLDTAKRLFQIGFEKIVINSASFHNIELITQISRHFGSQSVVGSIDVKHTMLAGAYVYSHHGRKRHRVTPEQWAKSLENAGVGEILITSMNQEGTWQGYDISLLKRVADSVQVPVIANGGAGSVSHLQAAVQGGASAVAVGSMVVFQKQGMGVLVNFPDRIELESLLMH